MDNKLKKHVDIIWVKVEFGYDREVLYWEGDIQEFEFKKDFDYIIFPRHGNRRVPTSKIKDFALLQPDDYEGNLELKLFSLTLTQRAEVKRIASNMKKNIGREPNETEINRFIQIVIDPDILKREKTEEEKEKFKKLNDFERFKTYLVIKKQKISKIVTGTVFGFNKK